MTLYLNDEKQYLKGEVEAPQGESILEKEKISSSKYSYIFSETFQLVFD
jgi:hypothetical protein